MDKNKDIKVFHPTSLAAWRKWLQQHHASKQAVWLVFHTKASSKRSISWSDAVDVALSFGWIDSKKISIGDGVSHQYFCKRKEKSTWSKINKEKVQRLIEDGLMTKAGAETIATAKQKGQKQAVLVKGDETANYGTIIQAMVLLQQAGVENVGLMTRAPK